MCGAYLRGIERSRSCALRPVQRACGAYLRGIERATCPDGRSSRISAEPTYEGLKGEMDPLSSFCCWTCGAYLRGIESVIYQGHTDSVQCVRSLPTRD